ncbi:hypothetical protein BFP76_07130 [Amylibacter kogurei]|uniref:Uncharacterized protein n=1 Tax=Paramylibacter kogurei TaxID=1889778 RepID=A0A2G5K7D1_9RHOB|nr:hypothetical protein [Amylibacter kogurei]PIB24923.1 hypothetical protein BFP76_07130 [Amylibacter kogurei]
MRRTALILGIISGIWGMIVGFFGYGYTEFINWFGEIPDIAEQVDNVNKTRFLALVAPILALVGGGMAMSLPLVAGALLILSAGGMYLGFEFGAFTMFPITLCLVAGILALTAGLLKKED